MIKIVPTVLANAKEDFDTRLSRLLPISDELQVDVMDGKFVPSQSIPIDEIPDMQQWSDHTFEVHLMVENPGAHIQPMARRGFKRIIFHVETINEKTFPNIIEQCRKYHVMPVLAINPETTIEKLFPYIHDVDGVVFLGVHPGFNGAPYVKETAKRIELLRKSIDKKITIQVDGGMTPETIHDVVAAGATRINTGSFVGNAKDPKQALKELYDGITKNTKAIKGKKRKNA